LYLKNFIEYQDGYKLFYQDGNPIRREKDIQLLFKLTWCGTISDVSKEIGDGRGISDYKISRGFLDKTIVEFKLASNSSLGRNLEIQAEIYKRASDAEHSLKVIIFFTSTEHRRVLRILKDLGLDTNPSIILIDARKDNKPSASKASSVELKI
jgi:hypothetical protein